MRRGAGIGPAERFSRPRPERAASGGEPPEQEFSGMLTGGAVFSRLAGLRADREGAFDVNEVAG